MKLEPLETRVLLSSAPFDVTSRGTLVVFGTTHRDVITIEQSGSAVVVSMNALRGFSFEDVKRVLVEGSAGADAITFGVTRQIPATLLGGSGDDVISASGASVTLVGGKGDDKLTGRGEHGLTFVGGRGDDSFIGSDGTDTFQGGAGNDTARVVGPGESYTSIERLTAYTY